jgi:putative transposase
VSTSDFHAWSKRPLSARAVDNQRLLTRIREFHAASDGVMGMPRMYEYLSYAGETASRNRVARLMTRDGLFGMPQKRSWQRKRTGVRPDHVKNHLERDFSALEPNTKWVTDITYIHTAEGWLSLCTVLNLFNHQIVGWSMFDIHDRHMVIKAVLMACWQRPDWEPLVLHSDRGTQFTSGEHQRFLADHNILSSMSAVGHCADNAAAEGFFGMIKRERARRRRYLTLAEARSDVFDYIERFHNPRMQRRIEVGDRAFTALSQLSAKRGRTPASSSRIVDVSNPSLADVCISVLYVIADAMVPTFLLRSGKCSTLDIVGFDVFSCVFGAGFGTDQACKILRLTSLAHGSIFYHSRTSIRWRGNAWKTRAQLSRWAFHRLRLNTRRANMFRSRCHYLAPILRE